MKEENLVIFKKRFKSGNAMVFNATFNNISVITWQLGNIHDF